jgi:hypothetical protein
MRIFVMLAIVATVVVIGYGISTRFFTQSAAVVSSTMLPHEIHRDYKGMEKLPVHDVKDAF